MGRSPDPKVKALRKEALRLEQEEGLNAVQIARIVGRKPVVVREWLRAERGPKVPVRDKVLAALAQGKTPQQVATEARISVAHVYRLQKEERGHLVHPVTSTEDQIDLLLSDPKKYATARFTRYESFGRHLIHRVHESVNNNPVGSEEIIETAKEIFAGLAALRRKQELKEVALCHLTQARFAEAARERALERYSSSLSKIGRALELRKDCESCFADGRRRQAMVQMQAGNRILALQSVGEAKRLYLKGDNKGHDFRGNGLGSCLLVEATVYHTFKEYDAAIRIAESALESAVPRDQEGLYNLLLFVVADSSVRGRSSGFDAWTAASKILQRCGFEPSLPRVLAVWLMAKIEFNDGKHAEARAHLEECLRDLEELKIPQGVAAALADLGGLLGNPTVVKDRICRLQRYSEKHGRDVFPAWLHPLKDPLLDCLKASADFRTKLAALRELGGGNQLLPAFG